MGVKEEEVAAAVLLNNTKRGAASNTLPVGGTAALEVAIAVVARLGRNLKKEGVFR